jgi:hypothetical protein
MWVMTVQVNVHHVDLLSINRFEKYFGLMLHILPKIYVLLAVHLGIILVNK